MLTVSQKQLRIWLVPSTGHRAWWAGEYLLAISQEQVKLMLAKNLSESLNAINLGNSKIGIHRGLPAPEMWHRDVFCGSLCLGGVAIQRYALFRRARE